MAAAVLAGFTIAVADAAPGRGGRGGGGGGAHFSGGGAHFGGGGARFGGGRSVGGGAHFGGGRSFGGGGARFGGRAFSGAHFNGRHFGGPRFVGGHRFGGRSALPRSVSRSHTRAGGRAVAGRRGVGRANRVAGSRSARGANPATTNVLSQRNAGNARSRARVSQTMQSRAVAGALRNRNALRNPSARAAITASAAMGAWQHGHGNQRHGWWRHRHGGYGWVGPLFWPFAYYDFYDYTMWGYGYDDPFWDYGYSDIYAGLFAPYGYDALAGYFPEGGSGRAGRTVGRVSSAAPTGETSSGETSKGAPDQLAQMCGDDSRDIAGLPIDRIQDAIQPNDEQRAALDDLANASVKAAQDLRAACPTDAALTAPGRLAAMEKRIEAMIAAVGSVRPPLDKFYGLLSDEQKARLNALGQEQRAGNAPKNKAGATALPADADENLCGATSDAGATQWPTAEIERRLQPTEAQRTSLTALQDASAKAADMLRASCQREGNLTPPARLAAVEKRLDTLLDAVKTVHAALGNFYGTLSDEQKAQFEAIGPTLMGAAVEQPQPASSRHTRARSRHHRHGVRSVEGMLRHFMMIVR